MTQSYEGCQTIGCTVTSCRHNNEGKACRLTRIQVEPKTNCEGCHSGKPSDESLCGSYSHK